jgi:hypothetical protein
MLFSVLAGVLQLGQITFDSKQGDEDCSVVTDKALLQVQYAYSVKLAYSSILSSLNNFY